MCIICVSPQYTRQPDEKTIRNMGKIGSAGMKTTDRMILDIMLCK